MTIRLALAPLFLFMAYITYLLPPPICTVEGPLGFLSSMWLMYALMALAHCGSWFELFGRAWQEQMRRQ